MILAESAARADGGKASLFASLFSDAKGVVRYWAAAGLLIPGEAAGSYREALLDAAQSDDWLAVQIVCAEALCHSGQAGDGLPILGSIATDTALPFPRRLQNLNALEELGPIALPLLEALRPIANERNPYLSRAAGSTVAKLSGTYQPEQSFSPPSS